MMAECSRDVTWSNLHYFEQALGQIVECKWAGYGHKLHVEGENLNDTVRRVMPDADWVIIHETVQRRIEKVEIPKKRICKIALSTMDVLQDPPKMVKKINAGKWDAIIMRWARTNVGRTGPPWRFHDLEPNYYLDNLEAPVFYQSHSINPEVFKPVDGEKKYDVSFLGSHHLLHYPLREVFWVELPDLAEENNWRLLLRSAPPGRSLVSRNIDDLLKDGHFVGKKYAEALALSKVSMAATGRGGQSCRKFVEAMGCGTCVLANMPIEGKNLFFRDKLNIVVVNEDNWKEKLKYYLTHDEEREAIARRGYETIMKYHTDDIRAQELVNFLEECS